jgi:hypothetical protein
MQQGFKNFLSSPMSVSSPSTDKFSHEFAEHFVSFWSLRFRFFVMPIVGRYVIKATLTQFVERIFYRTACKDLYTPPRGFADRPDRTRQNALERGMVKPNIRFPRENVLHQKEYSTSEGIFYI